MKAEGGPHRASSDRLPLSVRRHVSRPHLRGSLELFSPGCKITQGLSVPRKVQLRVKPSFGRPSIGYRWAISHLAPHLGAEPTTALARPLSEELAGLPRYQKAARSPREPRG